MSFQIDTIFHIRFSIGRFVLRGRRNPQGMRQPPARTPTDGPGTSHLNWKLQMKTEMDCEIRDDGIFNDA